LRKIFPYENGIPSKDTTSRFYNHISLEKLTKYFVNWVKYISKIAKREIISIDERIIRGGENTGNKSLIHIVSA
jgi:hypothetical protein